MTPVCVIGLERTLQLREELAGTASVNQRFQFSATDKGSITSHSGSEKSSNLIIMRVENNALPLAVLGSRWHRLEQ